MEASWLEQHDAKCDVRGSAAAGLGPVRGASSEVGFRGVRQLLGERAPHGRFSVGLQNTHQVMLNS